MGLIGGFINKEESLSSPLHGTLSLRPQHSHPLLLFLQAWPPEGRCVRDVTEPGALRMESGDPITVIEGR